MASPRPLLTKIHVADRTMKFALSRVQTLTPFFCNLPILLHAGDSDNLRFEVFYLRPY